MENIFLQLSALFGLTIAIAFVMRALRQPMMIAYIIAGIVSGPFFLNLINGNVEAYKGFSQMGIALLLFLIGLELNYNHIRKIGKIAVIAGAGQIIITTIAGFFLLRLLNFSVASAIYMAVAITFSSTIIIIKLLSDKKDTETNYGRYAIGLMIVQDIVAIGAMLFVTSLNRESGLLESLGFLVFRGILIVALVWLSARFILPKILDKTASSGEFLFLFTLAWCFGVASALYWAGFSIEIGAIVAGITLGSSPYQPEIVSRIKPLRDFFIILFFLILGSEMTFANLREALIPGLVISLFIIIAEPIILYLLFRFLKFTRKNSFFIGIVAAQVSEFGFILIFTGQSLGHLTGTELPILTLSALITIFLSSYAFSYNRKLYKFCDPFFKLFGPDKRAQKEEEREIFSVWLFGYHRLGWKICDTLIKKKIKFAVVDFNPESIKKLKEKSVKHFFGDISDTEFLDELPLKKSEMIISTIPNFEDQITLIKDVRKHNKKTIIIATLENTKYLKELYDAGANYVILPHLLGAEFMADILQKKTMDKKMFSLLKRKQKENLEPEKKF